MIGAVKAADILLGSRTKKAETPMPVQAVGRRRTDFGKEHSYGEGLTRSDGTFKA